VRWHSLDRSCATIFNPESDVDVLVDFEPDASVSFTDLDAMEAELSAMFNRSVDLISRRGVDQSPNDLRKSLILDNLETVYRAA